MKKYRVEISEPAENDLLGIVRYISTQLSAPATATQMVDAFEVALSASAEMPQKYSFVSDNNLASMGYRKLQVKNYIVFFIMNERSDIVEIHRILYARRDWLRLLGEGS